MVLDREEKRRKAIKLKFVFTSTMCDCCRNVFSRDKMWQLYRYNSIEGTKAKWHYCRKCMHSVEDVLNEVDSDECWFGIFDVDDIVIAKKDDKRLNARYNFQAIPFKRKKAI